jgi:wyosine [tRNA(Phe)-imidazoG37] synthetase (radical SAM superfamily)
MLLVFFTARSIRLRPGILAELFQWLEMDGQADHLTLADKVKLTLSAWDEISFQQIHRPAAGVTFDLLVQGERAFRHEYMGELSVEVFIIDGVNSQVSNVWKIAEVLKMLDPDRIDVNTAVRPLAVAGISASPEVHLEAIAEMEYNLPKDRMFRTLKQMLSAGVNPDF